MRELMKDNSESEGAIHAARVNMLRQEESLRTQVLGSAVRESEKLWRRETEIFYARSQGLLTQAEHDRARALALSEYNLAQQQEVQGLGVVLDANEQHRMSIERINNALAQGKITTEQYKRANETAALTAASAWSGAWANIGNTLAQAFPKQKAFAYAAAVMNVAEGATKALAQGGILGFAGAAAVIAAGTAQIMAIKNATPGGGGSVPSVGGGNIPSTSTQPAPMQPRQAITIDLHGSMFSREEVRSLVEGLNDFTLDGGTLIATSVRG
jgi:hypothetical protein